MTRTTGRNEIIRAALDSIVLQIQAVLDAMSKCSCTVRKQATENKRLDRQHYTIPNQRPKDKHCGKI